MPARANNIWPDLSIFDPVTGELLDTQRTPPPQRQPAAMPQISEEHAYANSPEFKAIIQKAMESPESLTKTEQQQVQQAIDLGMIPDIFSEEIETRTNRILEPLDTIFADHTKVVAENHFAPLTEQLVEYLNIFGEQLHRFATNPPMKQLSLPEHVKQGFQDLGLMPLAKDATHMRMNFKTQELEKVPYTDTERIVENFVRGAIRLTPELWAAAIESPYEFVQGLLKFPVEETALVLKAFNMKITPSGLEIDHFRSKEVEQAIEEIKQNPIGVLMLGLVGLGVASKIAQGKAKPSPYIIRDEGSLLKDIESGKVKLPEMKPKEEVTPTAKAAEKVVPKKEIPIEKEAVPAPPKEAAKEAPKPELPKAEIEAKPIEGEAISKEPTELGFTGITPEGIKSLGESTAKAMRSISASTSQMIKETKVKPEIRAGVETIKEQLINHDRFNRQAEITSKLLERTVKKSVSDKARQMLVAHAIEHKLRGPFWDKLTASERELARQLSIEKTKLDQFVKENEILEMLPESEKIRHLSHFWIDSKTGKPFKAMYGKFTKGLPQAKQRKIQDYATGMKATPENPLGLGRGGMTPSTTNPGEMIGLGWRSAMRAHQARETIKTLYNTAAEKGTGIVLREGATPKQIRFIESWDKLDKQGLTEGYEKYYHYALDKAMVFKDNAGNLVRMKGPIGVKGELFPFVKAYMENPTYNTFDRLISVSRSMKLGLNMFHPVSLAMQEAALFIGKLVTGHPMAALKRVPLTTIPRGLHYRKTLGPVERLLYEEGLELYRASEQVGEKAFFKGVGVPATVANVVTFPVRMSRDFIFKVVQPGMKTAFAHDTFLEMLPKYLKGTDWVKEEVVAAYNAGKTIPKEARQCARQTVQMADGHFSGEHWRRSLLETNRFMVKMYFSPKAQTFWNRTLLSKTWQREHLLVAKNVGKSFLPDKVTVNMMKLSRIHPAAKAEFRQYLYGAISIIGAVDVWNLMTTEMMDGKAKHIWQNPPGKGFAVRASWDEPDYTVIDKNGKEKTIKGGPAYIRPLKSLFEVAEWVHHPFKKFSYKLAPYLSALEAQMPNNKYRHYDGVLDIPKRTRDFIFDTFEPISVDQAIKMFKGQKTPQGAIFPFFGMPTSKIKARGKSDIRREIEALLKEKKHREAIGKALEWNREHPDQAIRTVSGVTLTKPKKKSVFAPEGR